MGLLGACQNVGGSLSLNCERINLARNMNTVTDITVNISPSSLICRLQMNIQYFATARLPACDL